MANLSKVFFCNLYFKQLFPDRKGSYKATQNPLLNYQINAAELSQEATYRFSETV